MLMIPTLLVRAFPRMLWPALAAVAAALPVGAADWPQWRGPQRNGISAEKGWDASWSTAGPRRQWSAQVGEGFSSVAVVGGRVYTMGNAEDQDTVWCLNAQTGKPLWKWSYPCPAGDHTGPRATPTVAGDRVYIMSREGGTACLNAATGKVIWGNDLARKLGAQPPRWGFAGSPLVEGNLVIFNVGSAGAALDRNSGKLVWKSGAGPSGYASPVAATLGGQRVVLVFGGNAITAVRPANGRRLWHHPWQTSYDVNAADPIVSGDTVFISSNYGRGCALLRISNGRPSVVWENRNMRNHFNTCVQLNGALYGNDENTLKCIDLRSGAERWRSRGIGKGGLIASDGKLLVLAERGDLIAVQAIPDRYDELSRAKVLSGTCWTHPVLADGRVYCRSHEGTLVCLDLK